MKMIRKCLKAVGDELIFLTRLEDDTNDDDDIITNNRMAQGQS